MAAVLIGLVLVDTFLTGFLLSYYMLVRKQLADVVADVERLSFGLGGAAASAPLSALAMQPVRPVTAAEGVGVV